MSWFALFAPDGTYQRAVQSLAGYPDEKQCGLTMPIEREPRDFERVDRETGTFIIDEAEAIHHRAGSDHIAAMHARKAIEAHLIAAGVDAPGLLLVREAALRGVAPAELAATVREKIAAQEALELERQAASLSKNQEV